MREEPALCEDCGKRWVDFESTRIPERLIFRGRACPFCASPNTRRLLVVRKRAPRLPWPCKGERS